MRNLKLLLSLVSFFTACCGVSQDYSSYYQLINEAEERFVSKRDTSCYVLYDQAFEQFQPFVKDPFIAAQIALHLEDSSRFYHYLKMSFRNGMPWSALDASPLISRSKIDRSALYRFYQEHALHRQVDREVQQYLCLMCYQSDSLKLYMEQDPLLNQQFHQLEDKARAFVLNEFLLQGTFPNERLFGVTTDAFLEEFHADPAHLDVYFKLMGSPGYHHEEYELRAKCPFNIVLHSKCFYREHKDLFLKAMMNGYVHPKEIGILEETSIIWHKNDQNPNDSCPELPARLCYNIFGNNPMRPQLKTFSTLPEDLLIIEENRKDIFMQKYSVDLQKKQLQSELGIKFFFDFKDS
jgi:hypothetical protein